MGIAVGVDPIVKLVGWYAVTCPDLRFVRLLDRLSHMVGCGHTLWSDWNERWRAQLPRPLGMMQALEG